LSTGVFKSMNSGATWSRLPNFTLDNGDAFLAITATSPAVLYVSAHRRDGSWAGLWRSDDGGATWHQRSATGLKTPPWYQGLVTVKPDDPSWVLVGSLSPYRSTDGGASFTKVGADIHVDGRVAVIRGVPKLSAATVMATDLRASASLILAGLVAGGKTEVLRVYHLDRGYERIEKKLRAAGAKIKRMKA